MKYWNVEVEVDNNVGKIFAAIVLVLGKGISATIFGSMASLVKNIDKGYDIFTTEMNFVDEDRLCERTYEVCATSLS